DSLSKASQNENCHIPFNPISELDSGNIMDTTETNDLVASQEIKHKDEGR
ncbi:hypothetical protein BgiMline_028075, partial [Biomphalaria glabrata]